MDLRLNIEKTRDALIKSNEREHSYEMKIRAMVNERRELFYGLLKNNTGGR